MTPSEIDTARFGFAVGQAYDITAATVSVVLEESRAAGLRLLLARCAASDWPTVHALEASGFLLMDTLVYLRRPLDDMPDNGGRHEVRPAAPAEADEVAHVARDAFRDYIGHYHTDPRLDPLKVAEIYPSWAHRATADPAVADRVLVAEADGRIAGFAALKRIDAELVDGMLYAVAPAQRGRGMYRALLAASIAWASRSGYRSMVYSTQLSNLVALKTVLRMGFVPHRSSYTFHRWFD
jgi:GNAT superfamily N-acetyltransferase